MILWRIAADTRTHPADDLSGRGAAKFPGRWNDTKQPVIYTAPTIALAVLETVAHLDDAGLPFNRYLIRIELAEALWATREAVVLSDLPITWDAIPAGRASVQVGSEWLASMRSPLFLVPSVIVPEEQVVLVNPLHPSMKGLKASIVRPFIYNRVLRAR